MSRTGKIVVSLVGVLVVGILILQVVPGPARTNPPVTYHITWDSPETETLMRQTCYDCHSNETVWPWYSQIAPMSWLVARDVNEGREALNISTGTGEVEGGELIEKIQDGTMPPASYLILHPNANLDATTKAELIAGIQASLGGGEGGERGEGEEGEEGENEAGESGG